MKSVTGCFLGHRLEFVHTEFICKSLTCLPFLKKQKGDGFVQDYCSPKLSVMGTMVRKGPETVELIEIGILFKNSFVQACEVSWSLGNGCSFSKDVTEVHQGQL